MPCDDFICKEHLNERSDLRDSQIQCSTCKQEFDINDIEIKSNKFIQKQIDDQLHLGDEGIALSDWKDKRDWGLIFKVSKQATWNKISRRQAKRVRRNVSKYVIQIF